jgi:putative SOS response-associated peptidase YedK
MTSSSDCLPIVPGVTSREVPAARTSSTSRPAVRPISRGARCAWLPAERNNPPCAADTRSPQLAGLWENRKEPTSQELVRTFTIITTTPNEVVAPLHDRMPVILAPDDYERWLDIEFDPVSLIRPYPIDEMVTWPVSTRVNKPENDDAAILDRVEAFQ